MKTSSLIEKPQLPLVTVNTTEVTASEMTVFSIITNQEDETNCLLLISTSRLLLPLTIHNLW